MSQHIVTASTNKGRKVTVTLGYDRPLDYVFCTVLDGDDILYSNLDDDMAGTELQDVEYFKPILRQLKIDVPEIVFSEVKSDQLLRVGNRVVHYTAERKARGIRRLIERLIAALRTLMTTITYLTGKNRHTERVPETIDLLKVIGEEAANEPEYCSQSYWRWEEQIATPLLEKLGYSNIRFAMGECDSFGPLTRIVTADKEGVPYRFIYG